MAMESSDICYYRDRGMCFCNPPDEYEKQRFMSRQ